MRKVGWVLLAVLLLGSGLAVVWPGERSGASVNAEPVSEPLPRFDEAPRVEADPAEQGLSLGGRVLDSSGSPVANARVHLASSLQQSLATVKCQECGETLLTCPARETVPRVVELLLQPGSRGLLTPALTTTTDGSGAFKFERLKGVDFSVWAEAEGLGAALRERAAPGDPVELFLPALRTLVGEVVDEQGRRIPHAHLHAISTRLPLAREANTDGSGRFRIEGLGEGPFAVYASAPGHLPASLASVEAGSRPIQISLVTPRTLEVEVRDQGKPADATLELLASHLSRKLVTKDGFARFEGLYPDTLTLSAVSGDRSAEPRELTLTEKVTRVQLELVSGGRVLVTAVDSDGQPVPNPEIVLRRQAGGLVGREKPSTGELTIFGPVPSGAYLVEAMAEGFKFASLPVKVVQGEVSVELEFTRGIVISGRVLDVYGRPAPGISVLVQPTGETVHADPDGKFAVTVPSEGLYTLLAHHSEWGGGQLQAQAPASGVELQLEPKGQVEVTVQSEGRRVEGAHVTMWIERDGIFRSDRASGPDGMVPMRGMPPGTYWLVANHSDFLPSARQRVQVREGEVIRVDAELKPGAGLQGLVVDTTGLPVSAATVGTLPRGPAPTTSDSDGRFSIKTLRPGVTYRLVAQHPRYDQENVVDAVPGESAGEVKIVLKKRDVFSGRVVDERREPIKRFRIDEHEVASADGRFELPLPSAGDSLVFAVEAQGYEPLMVEKAAAPELGDIMLSRADQITGRVVQEGLGPVADAVVTCEVCEESVLSSADGTFSISRPAFVSRFSLIAKKGGLSASIEVQTGPRGTGGGGPHELVLEPATRLFGTVFGPDGTPLPGVEVVGGNVDRAESISLVTGADGSFSSNVAPGFYRLAVAGVAPMDAEPLMLVNVKGPQMRLDLGSPPGSGSLGVELVPEHGKALWLVRGDVRDVPNPPGDSLRPDWGLILYRPRTPRVLFKGLAPGRYTVIFSNPYAPTEEPPQMRTVDVRGPTEVSFIR